MIVVAFACGSTSSPGAGSPSQKAVASVTLDPAIAVYANMVNSDVDALDFQAFKKFDCKTRDICVSELRDIQTLVESLLSDLDRNPPPAPFVQQAGAVTKAAQQLAAQIDATLTLMLQPNSNYVSESSAIDVHPLDLAAGAIVCWPKSVQKTEVPESASGYVCV